MADLVSELARLGYGKGIGDVLGRIGADILDKKRMDEVNQVLHGLTGVDLSTAEGMGKYRDAVFKFSQMGEPGKSGQQAIEQGIIQPMQLEQQIETQKLNRAKNLVAPYERNLTSYISKLSIPNLDPTQLQTEYEYLRQQGNSLLPQIKGYESLIQEAPPPVALRLTSDEKVLTPPEVGKDGFYHYRTQNTRTGEVKDNVWMEAPTAKTGATATTVGADYSKIGQDFLDSIDDKAYANVVKAIAEYRLNPTSATSYFRGNDRLRIRGDVQQYTNNKYDETQYNSRYAFRQNYTSGVGGRNIRSINTLVGHLQTLSDAALALDNNDTPALNTVKNFALKQTGDQRVTAFDVAANAVESELANVFKGTGATDQEVRAWRDALSMNFSPAQFKGAIDQAITLMGSRIKAMSDQWISAMGSERDFRFLSPESRIILGTLGVNPDDIDPFGAANPPEGQPPQDEFEQFKRK